MAVLPATMLLTTQLHLTKTKKLFLISPDFWKKAKQMQPFKEDLDYN